MTRPSWNKRKNLRLWNVMSMAPKAMVSYERRGLKLLQWRCPRIKKIFIGESRFSGSGERKRGQWEEKKGKLLLTDQRKRSGQGVGEEHRVFSERRPHVGEREWPGKRGFFLHLFPQGPFLKKGEKGERKVRWSIPQEGCSRS